MDFDYEKYRKYLLSDEWLEKANIIKSLNENMCDICSNDKFLQVHHKTYDHLYNELEHLDDLMVLCEECHRYEHVKIKKYGTKWLYNYNDDEEPVLIGEIFRSIIKQLKLKNPEFRKLKFSWEIENVKQ